MQGFAHHVGRRMSRRLPYPHIERSTRLTRLLKPAASLVMLALPTGIASAQRAETTAAAEASDAFGLSVAGETIGLYSDKYVRGFSPVSAGNLRFDGLYIDRQGEFDDRVFSDVAIRVGVTALDTALPAPTGVADFALRRPGDMSIGSVAFGFASFGSPFFEIDWAGVATEGLSLAAGASAYPDENEKGGGDGRYGSWFLSPTWTTASGLRVTAFASGGRYEDYEGEIAYYTEGPIAPPEVPRDRYLGQSWAGDTGTDHNYGLIIDRVEMAGWTVQAGAFRSEWLPDREVYQYVEAVTSEGDGLFGAILIPERSYVSWSGELQAIRTLTPAQDWRASVLVNVRARDANSETGGESDPLEAPVRIGEPAPPLPEPDVAANAGDSESVRQIIPGASLRLEWRNRIGLQLGLQRVDYRREVRVAASDTTTSNEEQPWIGSASTSLALGQGRLAYAAYTRGFEDSGYAPSNAENSAQILPAAVTEQWDAGVRWPLPRNTNLIASVFRLERPAKAFDESGQFGLRGLVRNEGVEVSVVSRPVEGLSIVAGLLAQRPRLLDAPDGVGPRAVGIAEYSGILELDYEPARWKGVAASLSLATTGPVIAKQDNSVRLPAYTTLDLGLRYGFEIRNWPASLRFSATNVADEFAWTAADDEAFRTIEQRAYQLVFAADF